MSVWTEWSRCESCACLSLQDWNAQVLAAGHAAEASPDTDRRPSPGVAGTWAEEAGAVEDFLPASFKAVRSAADEDEDGDVLRLLDELNVNQRTTSENLYQRDQ